jgi:hypothetical protein
LPIRILPNLLMLGYYFYCLKKGPIPNAFHSVRTVFLPIKGLNAQPN